MITEETREREEERILTTPEAARYLRVGERTIQRMAHDGKLPGRKVGRGWRFDRSEVTRWVRGGEA